MPKGKGASVLPIR